MAIHETDQEFVRELLRFLNESIIFGLGFPQTTVAGLKSAIAALSVNEPDSNLRRHAQSAVQAAADDGVITDTIVNANFGSAAAARSFLQGLLNPQLDTSTDTRTFAYSPRTGSV